MFDSNVDPYGASSAAGLENLNKSLTAGTPLNPGSGYPMIAESLDGTMKATSNGMNDIVFFKAIPKGKAVSNNEQYNLLTDYGDDNDGFVEEGGLPEETSLTTVRKAVEIKYIAEMRKVSHVMTLVNNAHGDSVSIETVAGTMDLLRKIERALWHADSAIDPLMIDGVIANITANAPTSVIDRQGLPPNEDMLNDVCRFACDAPNYGNITHLAIPPRMHSDLNKVFFPRQHIAVMPQAANGVAGVALNGWQAGHGVVQFMPDKFLSERQPALAVAVGKDPAKIPGVPTIAVNAAAAALAGSEVSNFIAGDAGTYRYRARAVWRGGKSASVAVTGSPVTVAVNQKVTFSLTEGAGPRPSYYDIYRSQVNGIAGTEELIFRVKRTAATIVVTDFNNFRAGTSTMVGLTMDPEVIKMLQLAPMMRIPFAPTDLAIRWAQLMYFAIRISAPAKLFVIKNVGRTAGSIA